MNGSDLTLAANLTADRMALMAATPLERTPLATGNHQIHVSLNGQQFADFQTLQPSVRDLLSLCLAGQDDECDVYNTWGTLILYLAATLAHGLM